MKISQLEYILAVESIGSINAAAEMLFISQSQLSSSIKSLEEELGDKIFVRTNKGVSPTPFGKDLLSYARSVVMQINQIKNLGAHSESDKARLTICTSSFRFVTDIVAILYNNHKSDNIYINTLDCSRPEAVDYVSEHVADIGVLRIWDFQKSMLLKQLSNKNVDFFPLDICSPTVIVGEKHPLYHHPSDTVSLEDLKDYTPIRSSYWKSSPGYDVYNHFFSKPTKALIYASTRASMFELLAKTDTFLITATPQSLYRHFDYYPKTRVFNLKESTHSGYLGWIKHKNFTLSPLAQEYIDLLSRYLNL